jgi:cytochrome d ubiquinol oxidase subunit I
VGDVFGSALAAEGIFAFFLESGFLAIALFGWDKVKPVTHFVATCLVCVGAHFSAVWIVIANSWQQTPAGFHLVGRGDAVRAEITDFWALVFNPSSMDRLAHVILGAYLAAAFLVLSVSAFYLIKGRFREIAVPSLKMGLVLAAVASLIQLASGHHSARVVVEHQPAKLAAFEGHFETRARAPLHLFGWVDVENERVIGPAVPGALSLLAHDDLDAEVTGLDAFDPADRPPVQATFQFFHLMVAIGTALIGISWLGILLWWRGWLFDTSRSLSRGYLWLLVFAVLLPQVANQSGWFTAEIGRQPWIVYGLLRTADGLSEAVEAGHVLFSLTLFGLIYLLLFALFVFLLDRKIRQGPILEESPGAPAQRTVSSNP